MRGKFHTPPANGASLGGYLVKNGLFVKKGQTKTALAPKQANFVWNSFDFWFHEGWNENFEKLFRGLPQDKRIIADLLFDKDIPFYFANPEIIEVKIHNKQTDI